MALKGIGSAPAAMETAAVAMDFYFSETWLRREIC
jgi:hypothetical protein